ncbi:MAG: hypothetical protein HC906_10115 [Bacteroidales bacterium]|nr:hypothetical protein [Bacteroidales bacterium]
MILQTNNNHDTIAKIEVEPFFDKRDPEFQIPPFHLSENKQELLKNRSINMQLNNAFFNDYQKMINSQESSRFYGQSDEFYLLDDYTRFTVMEEVLREYVRGVLVRKRKGDFYLQVINLQNNSVMDENPLILLDGMPLFKANQIMEFDPLKVKSIEVVEKSYFYKILKFPGIVLFSTYNGDLAEFTISPEAYIADYVGVLTKKEFFSPVYETKEQKNSRLPDFRELLYWNPNLRCDENGKIQVEFYSSDQRGNYTITLQGLTGEGKPISFTSEFQVE